MVENGFLIVVDLSFQLDFKTATSLNIPMILTLKIFGHFCDLSFPVILLVLVEQLASLSILFIGIYEIIAGRGVGGQ